MCDGLDVRQSCKYFVHHTTFVDVASFTHMPALPSPHAMRVEILPAAA
jgi:hypothetical protein